MSRRPSSYTDYGGFAALSITLLGGPLSGTITHLDAFIAEETIEGSLTNLLWVEVAQGEVSFATEAGDSNLVRLIAVDDAGWLFINGDLAAILDLSVPTGPSGVSAITRFFEGNGIPGRSTAFADFSVWSLD